MAAEISIVLVALIAGMLLVGLFKYVRSFFVP